MIENDFIPSSYAHDKEQGRVQWKAPSNIALVKYWGKKQNQIPANSSVIITLDKCITITSEEFTKLDKVNKHF